MPTESNGMKAAEIIRLTMPEFKSVTDEDLEKWISLNRPLVSKVKYKSQYEQAVALLVAHKMKLTGFGENMAGADKLTVANTSGLASVSEGESGISFDTGTTSIIATDPITAEYAKTIYGIQFLSLSRQLVMSIAIDGSGVRSWQR